MLSSVGIRVSPSGSIDFSGASSAQDVAIIFVILPTPANQKGSRKSTPPALLLLLRKLRRTTGDAAWEKAKKIRQINDGHHCRRRLTAAAAAAGDSQLPLPATTDRRLVDLGARRSTTTRARRQRHGQLRRGKRPIKATRRPTTNERFIDLPTRIQGDLPRRTSNASASSRWQTDQENVSRCSFLIHL